MALTDPTGMWDDGGWDDGGGCDWFDPLCWPVSPCFFFDCVGGGSSGGGGSGDSGGTASNTPKSTPMPPNSFPGGETLGLPPGMRVPLPSPAVMLGLNLNLDCEFGVCVGGVDDFRNSQLNPQQTAQIDAALYALAADFWRGIKVWINGRRAPGDPYETRLFGTHWCGPGGAGPTVNNLDRACQVHDYCYDSHNLSVTSNFNLGLSPSQKAALQKCNQSLCDASRSVFGRNDGGKYVKFYFSHVLEGTCH